MWFVFTSSVLLSWLVQDRVWQWIFAWFLPDSKLVSDSESVNWSTSCRGWQLICLWFLPQRLTVCSKFLPTGWQWECDWFLHKIETGSEVVHCPYLRQRLTVYRYLVLTSAWGWQWGCVYLPQTATDSEVVHSSYLRQRLTKCSWCLGVLVELEHILYGAAWHVVLCPTPSHNLSIF